ncbi:MAG TPA: DUF190 domain-containing protein [Chthoniobacterales bacterium]|nr:DUF190 domain-containing protein [Chthoniobacterales bacterium]
MQLAENQITAQPSPHVIQNVPLQERRSALLQDAQLLRIYLGESDRWEHQALYEALVLKAKEMGMAGATVLRSPMGFGATSHLHTAKILQLSTDLPIIIEIVDTEEKLNLFIPVLKEMLPGGLIILEKVKVLHYEAKGQ